VKSKNNGFTLVEMLTTVTIIAILIAMLVPSLSLVRRISKETAQKSQFATIDMAIGAFKSDYGDYPDSNWPLGGDYGGVQKLTEALVGWDLMGFHPKSAWRADGFDSAGGNTSYDPLNNRLGASLYERRGPYLELATAGVFKLDDLFGTGLTLTLAGQTFVICDVFKAKKITLTPTAGKTTAVMAGTPILYYKANTSIKTISDATWSNNIYNVEDNLGLISLGVMTDKPPRAPRHPLIDPTPNHFYDYDYEGGIKDPKATIRPWPYRPDSYILISAGMDGLYGTSDDIRNF